MSFSLFYFLISFYIPSKVIPTQWQFLIHDINDAVMIDLNCQLELDNHLGDGPLRIPVGFILIKLTEVRGSAHHWWYYSLGCNPRWQKEKKVNWAQMLIDFFFLTLCGTWLTDFSSWSLSFPSMIECILNCEPKNSFFLKLYLSGYLSIVTER